MTNSRHQRERLHGWLDGSPQHECQRATRVLVQRQVDDAAHVLSERMIPHVFDPAHDDAIRTLDADRSSDRRLAGPGGPRHKFIDDQHLPAALAILLIKIAALNEARAHGGKIAGCNRAIVGNERSRLLLGDALRTVGAEPVGQILIQRQMGSGTRALHAMSKLDRSSSSNSSSRRRRRNRYSNTCLRRRNIWPSLSF